MEQGFRQPWPELTLIKPCSFSTDNKCDLDHREVSKTTQPNNTSQAAKLVADTMLSCVHNSGNVNQNPAVSEGRNG
jgi:hypothetical protein